MGVIVAQPGDHPRA